MKNIEQTGSVSFAELENWLRMKIESAKGQFLPSIKYLAEQRNVGINVMHAVVRKLAREGLLFVRSRKRTEIISSGFQPPTAPRRQEEAASTLCGKIRESILHGTIRTGEVIPKIDSYVINEHVSRSTVCRAMRILAKDGYIHKKGKQWIAGGSIRQVPACLPSVLFIVRDSGVWRSFALHTNEFFFSLTHMIQLELERHGFTVRLVFTDQLRDHGDGIPQGRQEIEDLILSLGSNYRGVVIMTRKKEDNALITRFLSLNRPVVAFHNYFSDPTSPQWREYYTFLSIDWQDGVRTILQTLADKGHRVVAVPQFARAMQHWWTGWIPDRVRMIVEESRRISPRIEVRVIEHDEVFWYEQRWRIDSESFASTLTDMVAKQSDGRTGTGEILMRLSPALASVIRDRRITALIAPCDSLVRVFGVWFRRAGLSIPADLSLVGFDNDMLGRYGGYDTVDWGLAHLGYLGAHVIIGDLPLKIRKDRSIAAPCVYIDRGSVAAIGTG